MNVADSVMSHLFKQEGTIFAVLDGCSIPGLLDRLYRHQPDHECLYGGGLKPDMAEVAPYLVQLERDAEFTEWLLNQGWGNHWGIFAAGVVGMHGVRQHLRRILIVRDDEQRPVYFRYYDPRVLRVYLPTCDAEELAAVFGPITSFLMEDENPDTMLLCRVVSSSLKLEKRQLVS